MTTGDDRPPTSHERASGQSWAASYLPGPAPWDIGAPQPAVVELIAAGAFTGDVLDLGCGTGDNAVALAAHGSRVLGVDVAEPALDIARGKAAEAGLDIEFALADALRLDRLDRRFDTALDSALFHTFDPTEQATYAASLATVTAPGATLYLICFSDTGPNPGPHPVSRSAITAAFTAPDWQTVTVEPSHLRTRFDDASPAWLATIHRR
ncbi:class I SAM-dependent methyltransferase [Nocardia sp. AG03]|uniref:class I SAM-dependent methyltransferase n=1 Tax=Nocardia sp. AG03 TaxID=3025312 RepID=UPI002418300A|nr:class I SAM-dependent methyltransferase [Nocardia sp. AG03]